MSTLQLFTTGGLSLTASMRTSRGRERLGFDIKLELYCMADVRTAVVNVFTAGTRGGNPAPITLDADGLSDRDMQGIAKKFGHEAGFVLKPSDPRRADVRYRFFVPRHEMDMCGHGTLGTTWLLAKEGRVSPGVVRVETASGVVNVRVSDKGDVALSQPSGKVTAVPDRHRAAILDVLGIAERDLLDLPIVNAATSRVKTLVPLASPLVVNRLAPDFERMEAVCEAIGSTGLYPFACDWDDERTYHARQFPKASGFPEDAATGVAATALLFGLRHFGLIGTRKTIRVIQGEAMGRPSRMAVTLADGRDPLVGCWLSGEVTYAS
jgi:PhzF family phenazine biosynthesis protein